MTTVASSVATRKTSPVSVFQFQVYTRVTDTSREIDWLPKGKVGFTNVSGLGNSTESIEYKEGNDLYGGQFPGRSRPTGEVTLSRGLDLAGYLARWRSAILERTTLPGAYARCDLIIELYARQGVEGVAQSIAGPELIQRWVIPKAWPKDYNVDDLDSRGGTEVTIQRVVMACQNVPELLYPNPTV